MESTIPALAAIALMVAGLLVIPLGFPGLWLMLGVLALAAYDGAVGWWIVAVLAVGAAMAEVAEFFIVRHTSDRYGASRRAFWGAMAGGLVGVFIGFPIPILGPLIGGLLGTFAGAAIVTWWQTRHLQTAGRAALGAVIGRGFAAAVKTAAGFAILVFGAAALLW